MLNDYVLVIVPSQVLTFVIYMALPCSDFAYDFPNIVNPLVEALPKENVQLDSSRIQPTPMFRSVYKFKFSHNDFALSGLRVS